MTSIHVVNHTNMHAYAEVMTAYFQKRHEIFVEERGWAELSRPDGLERDQFDDQHTIYLLAIDGDRVVGGSRFYPTLRPHMISEVFMHLVQRPLPRNTKTLEWSRYFIVKERRVGRTECRLLAGVQQFCLEEGITSLTGLQDMWWVPRWQQLGFKVRPLGVPQLLENQPTMAVQIEISEASLASVRKLGGLKPSILVRHQLDASSLLKTFEDAA